MFGFLRLFISGSGGGVLVCVCIYFRMLKILLARKSNGHYDANATCFGQQKVFNTTAVWLGKFQTFSQQQVKHGGRLHVCYIYSLHPICFTHIHMKPFFHIKRKPIGDTTHQKQPDQTTFQPFLTLFSKNNKDKYNSRKTPSIA